MDYDQRNTRSETEYPYSDYYSTGGRYRPPKKPKNYGWMVAVLGVFLLCVAGGVVLDHDYDTVETAEPTASAQVAEQLVSADGDSAAAPETTAEATETPAQPVRTEASAVGAGTELTVSEEGSEEMTLQEIYKKTIPSVVSISTTTAKGGATGTGIIMSEDGYIITNYHVVSGALEVSVLLNSGEEHTAAVVGGDETSDLMVLKIEEDGLTPAEFGSSDTMEVGDAVVAIGDPLGIELRGTMTDGIVCGINRDVHVGDRTLTLMQTNAALNSGNSGGPLVNMAGQVIGINTMKISSSYSGVEGIGFAIPISSAKPIVDELVEKGYVSGRPAFGISLETLDLGVVLFYNLPGRLYVTSVLESSDAYEKGIRQKDVIVAIDGVQVSTEDEFNTVKNTFVAGDVVTLTVYRQGGPVDIEVELMDRADLG